MRAIHGEIRRLTRIAEDELYARRQGPAGALRRWSSRWPSTASCRSSTFSAGGIATPADAALMMQLGAEGVFVGLGHLQERDPASRAAAIVRATTNYNDPDVLAEVSVGLGEAMVGIEAAKMTADEKIQFRG